MKRMKILFIMAMLLLPMGVFAKSDYYYFEWMNDTDQSDEYIGHVTNDIIKIGDKYLAAGFKNSRAKVQVLDSKGKLIKEVAYDDDYYGRIKRIFPIDTGYVSISVEGGYIYANYLTKDFEIDTSFGDNSGFVDFYVSNDYDYSEVYAVKVNNIIYIFNDSSYQYGIIQLNVSSGSMEWVDYDQIPSSDRSVLDGYFIATQYDECFDSSYYIDSPKATFKENKMTPPSSVGKESRVKDENAPPEPGDEGFVSKDDKEGKKKIKFVGTAENSPSNYCTSFIKPYNEGYVIGLMNYSNNTSKVVYYSDEEKFVNTYSYFVKDGVQVRDNFLLVGETLELIDSTGKTLEENEISSYFEEDGHFISEHLIPLDDGFALTGSLEVEGNYYNDKTLYFRFPYKIYTKTDGNGDIEVIDSAAIGENIQFKVKAKEGYKLVSLRITDENGNSIEYHNVNEDTVFTMPNANVTIEARFMKNPLTKSSLGVIFGMAILVALSLILSGIYSQKQTQ